MPHYWKTVCSVINLTTVKNVKTVQQTHKKVFSQTLSLETWIKPFVNYMARIPGACLWMFIDWKYLNSKTEEVLISN